MYALGTGIGFKFHDTCGTVRNGTKERERNNTREGKYYED